MSCNADFYDRIIATITVGFNVIVEMGVGWLTYQWLVYVVLSLVMLPVAGLFVWSQYILIPKFVKWWYGELI